MSTEIFVLFFSKEKYTIGETIEWVVKHLDKKKFTVVNNKRWVKYRFGKHDKKRKRVVLKVAEGISGIYYN